MKTWMKGMLAAAGALLLMGTILTVTAQLMGAKSLEYRNGEWILEDNENSLLFFNWGNSNRDRIKEKQEISLAGEEIREIKTDGELPAKLVIQQGKAWGISYELTFPEKFECKCSGGKLKISYRSSGSLEGLKGEVITITVPQEAQLTEIDVASSLGSVELEDLVCDTLQATSSLGNIIISNLESKEIKLDCSLGNITAQNLTVEKDATIQASSGEVHADGIFRGEVDLSVDLGNAELILREASLDDFDVEASSDMGSLTIDGDEIEGEMMGAEFRRDNGTGRSLQVKSDMGNIEIQFKN